MIDTADRNFEPVDQFVDSASETMSAIRRRLHACPEPSGEEYATSAYLQETMSAVGLAARLTDTRRGVIVEPDRGGGRRIGMRADMDALRIADGKDVPYRSTVPGVMHGCGHDAHSAIVAGAALALVAAERAGALPWPVRWRAIFQPAEETNQGAIEMVQAGAVEGLDAIISLHVDPSRRVGQVGIREGVFTAACDELEIRIEGRGGHAARPHESLDPIAAAAQVISSIYLFVPRAVDSQDPVVVTIGQIRGGESPNVIPREVVLRGTIRTLGGPVRAQTKDHIRQLARGLAEASGTRIEVGFRPGPEAVVNDAELTQLARRAAADVTGAEGVQTIARPSMGGEDFANYLGALPGCMFRLGCISELAGGPPLHSPLFDVDERALAIGARILARMAVMWSRPEQGELE
ncbi:MAG: amidohydrolase [Bryobacteraceae bacterium]